MIWFRRSSEIAALRRAYPDISFNCLCATKYQLPLKSVFENTECVLEIYIPLFYPNRAVEFRMHNPIGHLWADSKGKIRYPQWMSNDPLLSLVENVISQFVDYIGYDKHGNLHTIQSINGYHRKDMQAKRDSIDARINKIYANPPARAIPAIIEADDDLVEHLLSDEGARLKLLYQHTGLSQMVEELKGLLKVNEAIALSIVSNVNKKHKLLDSVVEKIKIIESMNMDAAKLEGIRAKYRSTVEDQLQQRMSDMYKEISTIRQNIKNSETTFEAGYEELYKLYRNYNELSAVKISLFC